MRKASYWLILLALVLMAGVTVISALDFSDTWKLMAVQSGSMEPAIKTGSLVMIKKADDYQKEEVITYQNEQDSRVTATHRIVEIKDGQFITKGDANNAVDTTAVPKNLILGKVTLVIPLLGYLISFIKTLPGLIILIIVPSTIIVYSEILNIKNEIIKKLKT